MTDTIPPERTPSYFDLLAEIGITKHPGDKFSTDRLIEYCRIDGHSRVLEIGCGAGFTTRYLARTYVSGIVAVDNSERMIARAVERTGKAPGKEKMSFCAADAECLPFPDNLFDAVISESITAFAKDKSAALREYVRVIRPGGYVGLCETTWLVPPPPEEIVSFFERTTEGIMPVDAQGWQFILEDAGLDDITLSTYRMSKAGQFINELRLMTLSDLPKAWYRMFAVYFTRPEYRQVIHTMMREARHVPRNLLDHFGYGLYVGKKP